MNSSFKRRAPSNLPPPPPGTRPNAVNTAIRETSSGIPSLDDILGGGHPLGSVSVYLTPDPHGGWAELLARYFIAEGLASGQEVCVVAPGDRAKALIEGCMWLAKDSPGAVSEDEGDASQKGDTHVKIAWRYQSMKKFETSVPHRSPSGHAGEYCHTLDLTQKIPAKILSTSSEDARLTIMDTDVITEGVDPWMAILAQIRQAVANLSSSSSASAPTSRILRIVIPELGEPNWPDSSPASIIRFIYTLRSFLQSTPAVVLLALPSHLSESSVTFMSGAREDNWINKLGFISDSCISFSSFGTDPTLSSAFPTYHGFVRVHKAPSIQSLTPPSERASVLRGLSSPSSQAGGGGENNLGFRCTRKRFIVETLHLDVEGGVSERRTTPAASASLSGGSSALPTATLDRHEAPAGSARVAIEPPLPDPPNAAPPETAEVPSTAPFKPKKARKAVKFQSDDADLYDF